jgi:hypothetical protein
MTTDNMLENSAEGEHWKLFVWEDYIKVQGDERKFHVDPELGSYEICKLNCYIGRGNTICLLVWFQMIY